ncbi:Hypothetical predicted protein [Mytilus galloprovincialis]|uniref:Uncharacterized protein n=1 Tax=Mytilus galloprovincialis TaxID=29158 RepID=A0A8B6HDG7_MYTGA|nr:Hypothetical predicted protein [Mytilus galloprovincialis]
MYNNLDEIWCTLAFVNSWLTKSTLPFIWDDPTTAEDVSQVAVDVYNGCVRGKSTDQSTKTLLTGCMMTANFDLNNFMKRNGFFHKIVQLFHCGTSNQRKKRPSDAKVLASAAFPIVLNALSTITVEQVHQETVTMQTSSSRPEDTGGDSIPSSADLAMRKEFLVVSNVVDRVKELGGKVNKTVRINGKPTKCLTLPKSVFTKEKWQEIVNKIFDIQDVVDPEEQEEAAEAHLPQPDRVLNVEPVFPSLPPIPLTTTTPICTPPSSPSLPSPPQFEVDYPYPLPSLPPTPPQVSLERRRSAGRQLCVATITNSLQ